MKSGHTSSLRKNFHSEKNPNSWEALPDISAAPEPLAPVHKAAALSTFSQCHSQAHPHWRLPSLYLPTLSYRPSGRWPQPLLLSHEVDPLIWCQSFPLLYPSLRAMSSHTLLFSIISPS